MYRIFLLKFILLLWSVIVSCQFQYNEYDEVISFSYIHPKIQKLKADDKINTLQLPAYNNDSLFWINNLQFLKPNSNRGVGPVVRTVGFPIDTTIHFFKVATRIKIKEGYIWLYKITSPTAFGLGATLQNLQMNSDQYLCAHTNLHDSVDWMYEYHHPEVYTGDFIQDRMNKRPILMDRGYPVSLHGNSLYLEVFSPNKSLEKTDLTIVRLSYQYPTNYRLSDAPSWVRKKNPEIDFEYYDK